jgi:hypothetical protein
VSSSVERVGKWLPIFVDIVPLHLWVPRALTVGLLSPAAQAAEAG